MAIVISDTVLDELTCDICEKYLSVLPIKVFQNRRSVCGRCTKKNPDWTGANSSYNIIAEKTLFKCVNRYDGCRELLQHSNVEEHEKVCLEKKYVCPLCLESDQIPTFLLWKHFQRNHKQSVLNHPIILCNLKSFSDNRNVFMYRFDDYLFYFYLILNRAEIFLKVKVVFIGDEELASSISYKFHVNLIDEDLKICSNKFKCKTYENDNDEFYKINIKDFNNFVNIEVDLNYNEKSFINVPKIKELKSLPNSDHSIQNNVKLLQINSCLVVERCSRNIDYINLFENIKFTPITKYLTLRKLQLSSDFMTNYPEYSLTECEFGLVKENKVFFPVCINCNSGIRYLFVSKQSKHSLCRICFNFLFKQNLIDYVDYEICNPKCPLEYFCSCNCGKTFEYFDCLDHEWEMKKDKIKQKCFKCDEICNLEELIEHMRSKHDFNGDLQTNFSYFLRKSTNFLVFVHNQLIFVEQIEQFDKLYIFVHINKSNQQNITGLLSEWPTGTFKARFENFISLKKKILILC